MPNRAFRFIHAADLHLEQAPQGVAHVPDHLKDLFVDSAYTAARRVFEAACTEQVDFLVLAGDVLDARRTGPRGPPVPRRTVPKTGRTGNPCILGGWGDR